MKTLQRNWTTLTKVCFIKRIIRNTSKLNPDFKTSWFTEWVGLISGGLLASAAERQTVQVLFRDSPVCGKLKRVPEAEEGIPERKFGKGDSGI